MFLRLPRTSRPCAGRVGEVLTASYPLNQENEMLCLSRVLPSAFLLVGAASAQMNVVEKDRLIRVDSDMAPIHIGTYHAATGQWSRLSAQSPVDGGTYCTIYANNFYSAFFLDLNDGSRVTDEGRLPSTTSPEDSHASCRVSRDVSLTGYDNSYSVEKSPAWLRDELV